MANKSRARSAIDALHKLDIAHDKARLADDSAVTKTRGWDTAQVKSFVYDAIQQNRAAWDIVPTARRAIVALKFATIVTGLERSEIPTVYLDNLWADMCAQAEKWGLES